VELINPKLQIENYKHISWFAIALKRDV